MNIDPGEVLEEARKAFKDKDFAVALDKYKWFYENSIEIDRSYYGVRLSYCLGEWAELGSEYPIAKEALLQLKEDTLLGFKNALSCEMFHEYSSISEALKCQDEVFQQFMPIHNSDKELAKKIFTFVYEYCASNKMWEICREYLGNGYSQYKKALETFDHMMEFANRKSGAQGKSIYKEAVNSIMRETSWILNMLSYINAPDEYDSAISKIESDLKDRGYQDVYDDIYKNSPNKKSQQDSPNGSPLL